MWLSRFEELTRQKKDGEPVNEKPGFTPKLCNNRINIQIQQNYMPYIKISHFFWYATAQ